MRNKIITEINNIFDENIDLKIRNNYLEELHEEKNTTCEVVVDREELSELNKKIIKYGKDTLLDKVISSANISINKLENGTLKCTEFKDWAKESISNYHLPDNFSKEDIINILYDELLNKYNEKKARRIKEFEKSKSEEND